MIIGDDVFNEWLNLIGTFKTCIVSSNRNWIYYQDLMFLLDEFINSLDEDDQDGEVFKNIQPAKIDLLSQDSQNNCMEMEDDIFHDDINVSKLSLTEKEVNFIKEVKKYPKIYEENSKRSSRLEAFKIMCKNDKDAGN